MKLVAGSKSVRVQCKCVSLMGDSLDFRHTHRDACRDTYPIGAFDLLAYRDPESGREWFIPHNALVSTGGLVPRMSVWEASEWIDRFDLILSAA